MDSKFQNLPRVTYFSLGILFMYMAFNSCSNLQSEVMDKDGYGSLGFYILAVLYFFSGIGSILSTALINKIGTKWCLIIGGIGNIQWILTTMLAAVKEDYPGFMSDTIIQTLIFISTMINGLSVGILWSSANHYVAESASASHKGFFFSYFWSFYMAS